MAGGKTEGQDGGSGKEESAGENESSGISGQDDVSSADPQESAGASGNTGAENNNESIPTEGNGDQRDNTEDLSSLYENGQVKIYNLSQLKKVGTGEQIHSGDVSEDTFGTGDALTDENGNALTYGNDTQYMLMNDIPMSGDDVWTLPEGFGGSFTGQGGTADSPLYDAATDTIYVYNNYQLATIKDPEALKTVMSNDMIAEEFGVGQVVFADAEGAVQLEYTADHNYMISADFTGEMPELKAAEVQSDVTVQLGGRDYIGQVHKVIGGKDYILIGNEYQLRAIGSNTQVTPILFSRASSLGALGGGIFEGFTPYYPGDADFNLRDVSETGIDIEDDDLFKGVTKFQYFSTAGSEEKLLNLDLENPEGLLDALLGILSGILGGILGQIHDQEFVTVTDDGKLGDSNLVWEDDDNQYKGWNKIKQEYKNLQYTSDANYIIFRDIDLTSNTDNVVSGNGDGKTTSWDPIMLSGDMLGRKDMKENTPVTISHITVETGEELSAEQNIGIGFFGTISGRNDASNIGTSSEQTIVKDIILSDVTVTNNATKLKVDQSLIEGLLGLVGGLLGGLIDGITDILGGALGIPSLRDLSLGDIVTELLTLKGAEPDTYATGSFAGRVTGNVRIENCKVTEAAVTNVTNMTGGFVGYSEGREEYNSGLDGLLGGTVELLSRVLNIIPGIGLGDLIELLLQKDIPLGQLIPTGYKKPQFENCQVTLKENSGAIGTNTSDYNGGFVGVQIGTEMNLCTVTGLTKVEAKNYAGGFAGLERDDTLQGATNDLGISLFPNIRSKQTNCKVESTSLVVEAAESYAGGFNGCMANSISENGQITDLDRVTVGQDYSGGYTGRATIGYSIALDNDNISGTLLGSVGEVVNKVGTGGLNSDILQLVGVQGAEIRNYNIGGSDIIIEAKQNYAGGLVGSGDGTIIENSSADSSQKLNLQKVSAGSDGVEGKYAGGVAGALTTANGAGLLNEVVGLVDVQEYKASNINVDVKSVTATGDYAGGAFGLLTGGEVDHVSVGAIETVTANNYAGGFVGRSGVGSLVDAKGLDILGLGAVEVGNLVSIGNLTSVDIKNSTVAGSALTVSATGNTEGNDYFAGGFVSENNSGKIADSSVTGLKRVFTETTGYFWGDEDKLATSYAGGFAARSQVGGLANVGADGDTVGGLLGEDGLLEIDGLLEAVGYLIPSYTNCFVEFTDRDFDAAQVSAAVAGGFIGEMQGGTVDNRGLNAENKEYAVRNAEYIEGTYYAGGFAGKILSGGLAQSDGLSLLGNRIDVSGLLKLIPTYIPKVYSAGVQSSADGLKVYASKSDGKDVDSGSAGGYAGVTSGARISNSIVKELATKSEATDAAPKESDYAVKAPRFAGGYVGKAEIGSAAAVGQSLDVLGAIEIGSLTSAIAAVESKFEGCDVYGKAGGFNVNSTEGSAGGYAGVVEGSNFNDSDSYNFEYIIGVTSAGGYAGTIQPGDVASLAESTEVLGGLLSVDNLLQVAQTFIARIWNSETTAVPCGGYVIATGTSDGANLQGLAGGYAGYNLGGQIKGEYACDPIFDGNSFEQKTAAAIRIRSVEGEEFAGGFTGLMEAANVAETGNLKLLWGLVKAENLLQAVSAVYPTEENTKVTGPLDSMSLDVWNGWVDAVGNNGAYGDIFTEHRTFETEEALNDFLADYVYGYTVKANAKDDTMTGVDAGGSAGGYVGRMEGGVITNGHAQDLKSVEAYRSAGGFAGEMVTGTIADLGGLSIGDLDIVDGLGIVKTFVPVIYTSRVDGYNSGFTVEAAAAVDNTSIGNAGGFVGYADGAQIFDNKDGANKVADTDAKAAVATGLRTVTGHKNVGGFAGIMQAGAALGADVTSSSGLLNQILSHLISQEQVSNLVNVLQATRTVVDSAEVTGYMPANEGDNAIPVFSVVGNKGEKADFAGGFAGKLTGALIGDESSETKDSVVITGLKSVAGGKHVGGFFGLADVDGLVEVAEDNETSILGLIGLGNVDVLNAFRTYIYSATVNGAENSGLSISAKERTGSGITGVIDKVVSFFTGDEAVDQTDKDGNAGGFGGSLKDSSVVNCEVNNLNRVNALTYAGGFIGFTGKSGVVDVDNVDVLEKLLGASAGVADIFGSQVKDSNVNGSDKTGYIIRSKDGEECIAGGFIGYGDLARVDNCRAQELKQVYSDQIAGGFIGKTSFAYLAEVDAGSNALLNPILSVVNQLLKYLYLDDLQNIGLIHVTLPEPFDKVLDLEVLNDNNVLSVTLLGLTISVGLVKGDETTSDVAQIHIGDSYIEVKCHNDPNGKDYIDNDSNISIGLIKANRTRVGDSSVRGITIGYDVFGGGAGNEKDGTHNEGYAGGFVGYNDEGLFETNQMYYADTIRGTDGKVGEFSGQTSLETVYGDINNLDTIEGNGNIYRVYRLADNDDLRVVGKKGTVLNAPQTLDKGFSTETIPADNGAVYYVYGIQHRQADFEEDKETSLHKAVWKDAYQAPEVSNAQFPIKVYVSNAQADLMLGTPTDEVLSEPEKEDGTMQDPCDETAQITIQKLWFDNNNNANTRPTEIKVTVSWGKGDTAGSKKEVTMSAADAGADPDSWSKIIEDVPIRDAEGNLYKYTVKEEVLDHGENVADYVTIYEQNGYTIYVSNYLTSTLAKEDTVVIDYGLPVEVDVMSNDKFSEDGVKGTLEAVGPYDTGTAGKVTKEIESDFAGKSTATEQPKYKGKYGTAEIPTDAWNKEFPKGTPVVRYTPNTMQMDSYERMRYAVKVESTKSAVVDEGQNYVYGSLTVIPATEIYYEDNFETVKAEDGTILAKGIEYINAPGTENQEKGPGIWETVNDGTTAATVQDTDRPGSDVVGRAWDDWYGNDTHYENDFQYSNGTSHVVTVDADNKNEKTSPKAEFTFTGTGFDVISVTSGDTGVVKVNIYKPGDEEPTWTYTADTYYGYKYNEESREWEVLPGATDENALYQTPILKVEDLPYDTYRVEIVPRYLNAFDHHYEEESSSNDYKVYLDAIRVYNPAGTAAKHPEEGYDVIDSVYQQDGEQNPRFTEIRDILLNAENMHATLQEGTVFVDGNDELASIEDYENFGPKNEVYLKDGQGISFYLWSNYIPDKVQLSAKLADGSSTDLTFAVAVNEGTGEEQADWKYYKIDSYSIGTSHDMYYDFADQCIWEEAESGANEEAPFRKYRTKYPIVIANTRTAETPGKEAGSAEDILSITNLQWTGNPEAEAGTAEVQAMAATESQELIATADMSNVRAAYYFLSEPAEENPGDVPGEGEDGKPEETPGTNPGEGEGGESEETPGTTPGEGEDSKPEETPGTTPGEGEDSKPEETPGTTPGEGEDSKPEETPGTNPGEETGGDQSETPDAAPGGGAEDNSDSSKDGNSDTATSGKGTADRTENGVDNERKPAVVTGDQSAIGLTVIIMILALGAIAAVLVIRRKNHRKR